MKKIIIMLFLLLTVVLGIGGSSIEKIMLMPSDMPKDFNFIIAYGHNAKNKIDTFENEYTKDLVIDGSATCKITFTDDEIKKIYKEMQRINIVNYPKDFAPPYKDNPEPGITTRVTPYSTYYFKVQVGSKIKEINWIDNNMSQASTAKQLHGLIRTIMEIVEAKEEYKKLPEPKGGYI